MLPCGEPSLPGNIFEDDGPGLYEAAGRDRAVFMVENGGMGASTGNTPAHGLTLLILRHLAEQGQTLRPGYDRHKFAEIPSQHYDSLFRETCSIPVKLARF